MPTQKESHAKRASISLTPRFHRRGTPRPQHPPPQLCETNPIYRRDPRIYELRTTNYELFLRNKPNYPDPSLAHDRKCETNPIPRTRCPANPQICETNPILAQPPMACPQLCETNPIPPTATIRRTKNTKRTQSPSRLSSRASGCGAKRSGPKPRDPLNHHRRRRFLTSHQRPKYAKRTQSPPPLPSAEPKIRNEPNPSPGAKSTNYQPPTTNYYAKRTQFPPISDFRFRISPHPPPIMRNEPNLPNPTPTTQTTPHRSEAEIRLWRIIRNEPNSPYRWRLAGRPIPNCAKRTQYAKQSQLLRHFSSPLLFSSTPLLHYSTTPLLPLPLRIAQNEPNFAPATPLFTSPLTIHYFTKRTQFPAPRTKYGTSAHGGLRTKC